MKRILTGCMVVATAFVAGVVYGGAGSLKDSAAKSFDLDARDLRAASGKPYYAAGHQQRDPMFEGAGLNVAQQVEVLRRMFPDLKLRVVEQFEDEKKRVVVNLLEATGTHKGAAFGVKPSGRSFKSPAVTITWFNAEGQETKAFVLRDDLGILQQGGYFKRFNFQSKKWELTGARGNVTPPAPLTR